MDERKIGRWISESMASAGRTAADTGDRIARGGQRGIGFMAKAGRKLGGAASAVAGRVADTGKAAGSAVASGSGKAADAIAGAGSALRSAAAEKATRTRDRILGRKPHPPTDNR